MEEEIDCKDCMYYKEWAKPLLRQQTGKNNPVEMNTESICKTHEKRYSSDRQWHPANTQCFTPKE